MVQLRSSVAYMVLMIAGAIVVEGALVALPTLIPAGPTHAAPASPSTRYHVDVQDLGEGKLVVEMRASN